MPWIELGSQRLYFAEHLKDQPGPTLILLHGAGSSHLVWPAALRRIPSTRVVALDLPGHGRSSLPGRRLIAHYASIVGEFIHAMELTNPVLLGHSMGGAIALSTALMEPALAGLIILGAAAQMRVSPALLAGCLSDIDETADFVIEHSFVEPLPSMRAKSRAEIRSTGAVTTFGDFLACSQLDLRDQLAGITTPNLVIGGTGDRMVPARAVESLAKGLPNAQLILLEGAGHFLMLERPAEVAGHVIRFLAGLK